MPYYFVAATTRHDAAVFTEYLHRVTPLLIANNCKPLSVNADFKVVGGEARLPTGEPEPDIAIILEFPSEAAFDNWWNSDEYAEIAKLRHESSTAWIGFGAQGEVRIPSM